MATFDHIASDAGNGASPFGSAFATAPTAGNTLVVSAAWTNDLGVATVASSNGNTYTLARSHDDTGSKKVSVWVANNCNGGAETVTLTLGTVTFEVLKSEYAKGTNALAVDQVASANANSTDPNSGNTPTTTAANELVYGIVAANSSSPAAGAGFTSRANGGSNLFERCEDKVVSSTGAQAAAFTSASQGWICICVTLMEAGGGAPTTFLLGQGCM